MTLHLVDRAEAYSNRTAIVVEEDAYTYSDLLRISSIVATRLLSGRKNLNAGRICILVPPGWDYVVTMWGIWRAGGVAVPMAISHPPAELAHVIEDAKPEAIVAHPTLSARINILADERGLPVLESSTLSQEIPLCEIPIVQEEGPSMILYTSGTTGQPKGVVLTHKNIRSQVESLTVAWGWDHDDHILLHLPLHHVHGIVNVLLSALWNGSTCEIFSQFNAVEVWERLSRRDITLYMAVPTVYRRLIEAWKRVNSTTRTAWASGAGACRLSISGSAALPVTTLELWEEMTGQRLLERYGMTEIGMALSNPLDGERRPGYVGKALPGIEVRLVDEADHLVAEGEPGLIQVRGATVFNEYWRQPKETEAAFTSDGWFITGDQAVVEAGAYRILGRSSVDILKTGGEKISALEIEGVMLTHSGVRECAVVGVPDVDWGDRVCAAIVSEDKDGLLADELLAFAQKRLAPYKVPKEILIVSELPRNTMGKVTKPEVLKFFKSDKE
ncbi:MAG TPA: long-chain fatty acid--CoA ligase [Gemmatimonadetes bacterium]|nr:long-chain fatty acid--CoA ligase [Gemmatimonadota bacterium]HIL89257.1 long-chain fatty acid--CoA ligase [Gemmatimonadota bacterium]